ncbi:YfjI family protein [Paeniroseomonas aquatica]
MASANHGRRRRASIARSAERRRRAEEKRPLFRPLPPPPEFPAAALGPLRDAAEAIQMQTQAPIAMCGNSVLAAATLAVQAQRDIELPGGGRKPLTAIYVSVAESGERKTTVDKVALASVYRMEEAWRGEHDAARQHHANDHEAWKAARDTAKNTRPKGDRAATREALNKVGPEPKAPPHPMLLVADPTPEGLILHLREGRPWAGVFTAEGGLLVGGAAFNDESRMRTAALFNTLWDGEPIRRIRAGTGAAFLPGRRCTAHVMLQPVVADKLFGDPMLDGIGMLARTLLVAPESTAGTRMFRQVPAACQQALVEYGARLDHLLRRPPAAKADDPSVLDPPPLRLHPDAVRLWIAFHDAAEAQLLPGGEFVTIKAFGAKLAEHVGRLAAVLTVYADPDAMEVPPEMMVHGIMLAKYYAAEMLRLQGASTVTPDLRLAARLLAWWQARPDPRCHLAAIYQRGLNALGNAATARRIVGILVEHGWVERLPPRTELDGAPRRDAWELVP